MSVFAILTCLMESAFEPARGPHLFYTIESVERPRQDFEVIRR